MTVEDTTNGPTITAISDMSMVKSTTSGAIAFTVGDPQGAGTLSAPAVASSNGTLLLTGGMVIGGASPDFTLTLTPVVGETGTATITVTVSDGTITASRSFLVTVNEPAPPEDDDDEEEGCAASGSGSSNWIILLSLMLLIAAFKIQGTRRHT